MGTSNSLKQRLRRVTHVVIAVGVITLLGDIVSFRVLQNAKNSYRHTVDWIIRLDEIGVKTRDLTISIQTLDNPIVSGKRSQFEKTNQALKTIERSIEDLISTGPSEEILKLLQGSAAILETQIKPTISQWYDSQSGDTKNETSLYKQYLPLKSALEELLNSSKQKAQQASLHYGDRQSFLMRLAAIVLAVFLTAATGLSVILSRRLSGAIIEILYDLSEY
ncbi:MAG: hypothetical protein HYX41_03430 [Bdellovibrio sp.]|nr:hypothetical protein [Bdellovibrio sp.]